jgi:hypothetical protein
MIHDDGGGGRLIYRHELGLAKLGLAIVKFDVFNRNFETISTNHL